MKVNNCEDKSVEASLIAQSLEDQSFSMPSKDQKVEPFAKNFIFEQDNGCQNNKTNRVKSYSAAKQKEVFYNKIATDEALTI